VQLDDLPEDLVKLEALRELDVSHNMIKTFPPEMGRMQNLQMFVISSCKVQALPPEVRACVFVSACPLLNVPCVGGVDARVDTSGRVVQ
jgi:Leucine-rich repeat (LRR) protein